MTSSRRDEPPANLEDAATGVGPLPYYYADIWAMRDAGFVDRELRDLLVARGEGSFELDYDPEPTPYQTAYALLQYEQLAAHMNETPMDGRRDWTTLQAWGLSRAAWAIKHGFDPEQTKSITPWPSDLAET